MGYDLDHRNIEARKGVCDELKTEVSLIPPDEKDSGESIANGSDSPDTVNSHRSSRWEGQDYIEAHCMGCRQRRYTEDYCADCYELSHYDEDGNTIESVGSDPPSPRHDVPEHLAMAVTQTTAASASNDSDDE
jgi:hypothetical protein